MNDVFRWVCWICKEMVTDRLTEWHNRRWSERNLYRAEHDFRLWNMENPGADIKKSRAGQSILGWLIGAKMLYFDYHPRDTWVMDDMDPLLAMVVDPRDLIDTGC